MKKLMIIASACLAIGSAAFAAETKPTAKPAPQRARTAEEIAAAYKKMTPAERAERRRRFMEAKLRHTGGRIVQPGSMQGSVVFYDAQATFKHEAIDPVVAELVKALQYDIRSEKLDKVPAKKEVAAFLKQKNVTFAIFLVDDGDDPNTLSIYPEQRYALVNAKAVGGKDLRFQRELKRTFAFLCGAACSTYPASLLSAVVGPIDLDTFANDRYSVDIIQRISVYMKGYDVTPKRTTSYRQAVEEGWAPAPTNEYQKAVWDEVRSIPTKPIEIKP